MKKKTMMSRTLPLDLPVPPPAAPAPAPAQKLAVLAAGTLRPTAEQEQARSLFQRKEGMRIVGYAGAAKTSTLELLARSTRDRGLYLAFNRAIRDQVQQRMPSNVRALTTHALALRSMDSSYPRDGDKLFGKPNANATAQALDLTSLVLAGSSLTARQQAASILSTIGAYCNSADPELSARHVVLSGRLAQLHPAIQEQVAELVVRHSRRLWERMTAAGDPFPLGHSGYMKLWSLRRPRIHADFILLDEAQDTSPATAHVLAAQHHLALCAVGDSAQQIYGWRGAVNAMDLLPAPHTTYLSQSFRFGPQLAELANVALALLEADVPMRGNPDVSTAVGDCLNPTAVLARTNAGVIAEVAERVTVGLTPHVLGGTVELVRLLEGVRGLRHGVPSECPELFGYRSWDEVVQAVGDRTAPELKILVDLVASYGEDQLLAMLARTVSSPLDANITVSTAHKAKGAQWNAVALSEDFAAPERMVDGDVVLDLDELRLLYVAMTRARLVLSLPLEVSAFLACYRGEAKAWWDAR